MFSLLTGGYPGFYGGPGPRGRLLGNDDSRVTGKSLDPQDHRYVCLAQSAVALPHGAIAALG